MGSAAETIPPTDPGEEALDGTSGGALDGGDSDDIESPDNTEDANTEAAANLTDDPDLRQQIVDTIEEFKGLSNEAAQINARKRELIESLEAKGVNRHAFRYVLAFEKMDESQRQGLDLSYMIGRRAIGQPVQGDLFDK